MEKPGDEERQQDIEDMIREEIARRRPIDTDGIRARRQERTEILAVI
jgi:hypothetical protein